MATTDVIIIPAGVATPIVTGTVTGQRVLLQTGGLYRGGSDVSPANGIFITSCSCNEFADLGKVPVGETIYAYSEFNNEARVLYYLTL